MSLGLEPPPQVLQAMQAAKAANLKADFICVDQKYYEWTLEERAKILCVPSIQSLCKTLIFKNTKHSGDEFDALNCKYIAVVVQYVDKLSTAKLNCFVRELGNLSLAKKKFNFRLCEEEIALNLSGFSKNGVCPFGFKEGRIPVVITAKAAANEILAFGGGHVDWKVVVNSKDFQKLVKSVVDLSED